MTKGYTLVEVMVTTVIVSVIALGVYNVLGVRNQTYTTDADLLGLQQQSRIALDRITRDVRQAEGTSIVINAVSGVSDQMTFDVPTNDPALQAVHLTYYLNGNEFIRQRQIVYLNGQISSSAQPVASDIAYLKFTPRPYISMSPLKIWLCAEKTYIRKITFPVQPSGINGGCANAVNFFTEAVKLRHE